MIVSFFCVGSRVVSIFYLDRNECDQDFGKIYLLFLHYFNGERISNKNELFNSLDCSEGAAMKQAKNTALIKNKEDVSILLVIQFVHQRI